MWEMRVQGDPQARVRPAFRLTAAASPREQIALPVLDYAAQIGFSDHKRATEWGRDEWLFFLADAACHLNPQGSLHLAFNPRHERYGPLKYFDHGTYEPLAACGEVDRSEGT